MVALPVRYRIALDPRDWEAARQAPTGTRADDDEDEAGEKEDEQEQNYHRRHAAYDQTASGSRSTSSTSTAKSSDHPRPTGSTHAHPGSSTKKVKRRLDSDRENDDGESECEEEDRQQPGVLYSAPQRKKKKRVLKTFRGVDSQQLAQASQVGAHGRVRSSSSSLCGLPVGEECPIADGRARVRFNSRQTGTPSLRARDPSKGACTRPEE